VSSAPIDYGKAVPQTLPANFAGWDKEEQPPATLPTLLGNVAQNFG